MSMEVLVSPMAVVPMAALTAAIAVWRARQYELLVRRWSGERRGGRRFVTALRAVLVVGAAAGMAGGACAANRREARASRSDSAIPAVMFVIDVSRSMEIGDVGATRSRAAEMIVRQLIEGQEIVAGLVAVAGEAEMICPPTIDHAAFAMALDELPSVAGRLVGGSAIGDGVLLALQAANNGGIIVLLSDGEPTSPGLDAVAARSAQAGVRIHPVGVGSREGGWVNVGRPAGDRAIEGERHLSRLDEPVLRALAEQTSGRYFNASDRSVVSELRAVIRAAAADRARIDSRDVERFALLMVLVALSLEFLVGRLAS
jgi:hypothetical protein